MAYEIVFERSAERAIDALQFEMQERIILALYQLSRDPYAYRGAKALAGGGYRIRVGDYRVVYDIEDERLQIVVVRVGDRKVVYRRDR